MRISDWSSDVCSSDLRQQRQQQEGQEGEALVHGRISSCGGNEREGGLRLGARGALHRDQLFGDLQRLRVAGGLHAVLAVHDQGWGAAQAAGDGEVRSEEHRSELQSLMRNSYAVLCLKKKKKTHDHTKAK